MDDRAVFTLRNLKKLQIIKSNNLDIDAETLHANIFSAGAYFPDMSEDLIYAIIQKEGYCAGVVSFYTPVNPITGKNLLSTAVKESKYLPDDVRTPVVEMGSYIALRVAILESKVSAEEVNNYAFIIQSAARKQALTVSSLVLYEGDKTKRIAYGGEEDQDAVDTITSVSNTVVGNIPNTGKDRGLAKYLAKVRLTKEKGVKSSIYTVILDPGTGNILTESGDKKYTRNRIKHLIAGILRGEPMYVDSPVDTYPALPDYFSEDANRASVVQSLNEDLKLKGAETTESVSPIRVDYSLFAANFMERLKSLWEKTGSEGNNLDDFVLSQLKTDMESSLMGLYADREGILYMEVFLAYYSSMLYNIKSILAGISKAPTSGVPIIISTLIQKAKVLFCLLDVAEEIGMMEILDTIQMSSLSFLDKSVSENPIVITNDRLIKSVEVISNSKRSKNSMAPLEHVVKSLFDRLFLEDMGRKTPKSMWALCSCDINVARGQWDIQCSLHPKNGLVIKKLLNAANSNTRIIPLVDEETVEPDVIIATIDNTFAVQEEVDRFKDTFRSDVFLLGAVLRMANDVLTEYKKETGGV